MSIPPVEPTPQDPAREPNTEPEVAETDWKAEAKKWESRSKANAAAARRLEQIEAEQKTAEQKAAEREAAAEQRAAAAETKSLRREVALEHGLNKDDAALLDAVADEDAMRALAKRLAAQDAKDKDKRRTNRVPGEGTQTPPPADDRREFIRRLTGRE